MKRHIFTILIAILVISALGVANHSNPIAQAGGSWSAWIYNSDNGRLVHVFPDGAPATTQSIPLPPGTSSPPYSLTVSRDGSYLAACVIDDANNTTLRVYDLYNNMTVLSEYPAGQVQGCSLTYYAFSEDSSLLAFGLFHHYPDPNDARPEWELIVMDTFSGSLRYRLGTDMPVISTSPIDFRGKMPVVSTFQQPTANQTGLISFSPVQWGTEGSCEYTSVTWNMRDNTVYEGGRAGKAHVDYLLPNSEAIWVEVNDAYPKTLPMGPGCAFNMVMYSNKAGDLYPLFTNGTIVGGTEFIDDGRKIAFYTDTGAGVNQWWGMTRAGGNPAPLPADIAAYEVWGTLDGYVFLNDNTGLGGAPEVRYHRFTGRPNPDAFVAWTGAPGEYWRIIWVNDLTGGAGLSPFPEMDTNVPVPTPPPAGGVLTVGGQARINTTEGDPLRVRMGPGTTYAVAFHALPDTIVTLLEGPVAANGYNWWRISVPGRGEGWAIEGLQEPEGWLQTLVPVP